MRKWGQCPGRRPQRGTEAPYGHPVDQRQRRSSAYPEGLTHQLMSETSRQFGASVSVCHSRRGAQTSSVHGDLENTRQSPKGNGDKP